MTKRQEKNCLPAFSLGNLTTSSNRDNLMSLNCDVDRRDKEALHKPSLAKVFLFNTCMVLPNTKSFINIDSFNPQNYFHPLLHRLKVSEPRFKNRQLHVLSKLLVSHKLMDIKTMKCPLSIFLIPDEVLIKPNVSHLLTLNLTLSLRISHTSHK